MGFCVSYCVFVFALFIMSICVWLSLSNSEGTDGSDGKNLRNSEGDGELVFVHVFYRHGDRNPVLSTSGSEYTDLSYWPEGWGQLTILGIQQAYSLGQWFRGRYDTFLSETYNAADIYVRSSDVDRTLMTAQSVLAGLYPPRKKQIWKKNFYWQPIPIHTVPTSMDYLTAALVPKCSSYEQAKKRYLASDKITKYRNSIQPIFDYVNVNTGKNMSSFADLTILRDTWTCETAQKYPHREWVRKLYPNNADFEQAAMTFYTLFSGTKFLSKFSTGFLLKDILDRFTSKTQNTLTPNRKLWMYSTHDLTLFNFLRSLDISDNQYVPYTAAIILELRKVGNEHLVQIFYKNSDKNPEPIDIPGCGTACPLSKMYQIYDNIIPKNDFDVECLIPEEVDKF